MRPLWLSFVNMDPLGGTVLQIFKNGDGKYMYMYMYACPLINIIIIFCYF